MPQELVMIAVTEETRTMLKELARDTGRHMYAVAEDTVREEHSKMNKDDQ